MSANVVQVEAVVEEYLNNEDAEPAAIFLDMAAVFPSAGWSCMRWALRRLGVPAGLDDATVRLYDSAFVHIVWGGGVSSHSLLVTCGIRQGCPASGTLWASLYGLVIRRAWQSFQLGGGLWLVFADDIAVVLRGVVRCCSELAAGPAGF